MSSTSRKGPSGARVFKGRCTPAEKRFANRDGKIEYGTVRFRDGSRRVPSAAHGLFAQIFNIGSQSHRSSKW